MADYVECPKCGDLYLKDEPWKRVCLSCWKKAKGKAGTDFRTMWERADAENFRLILKVADLERQLASRPAFDSALLAELKDMLPRLRQLCHPDKHDGSVAANRASQWLNNIRERLH